MSTLIPLASEMTSPADAMESLQADMQTEDSMKPIKPTDCKEKKKRPEPYEKPKKSESVGKQPTENDECAVTSSEQVDHITAAEKTDCLPMEDVTHQDHHQELEARDEQVHSTNESESIEKPSFEERETRGELQEDANNAHEDTFEETEGDNLLTEVVTDEQHHNASDARDNKAPDAVEGSGSADDVNAAESNPSYNEIFERETDEMIRSMGTTADDWDCGQYGVYSPEAPVEGEPFSGEDMPEGDGREEKD